jgi:hypothetical protein
MLTNIMHGMMISSGDVKILSGQGSKNLSGDVGSLMGMVNRGLGIINRG